MPREFAVERGDVRGERLVLLLELADAGLELAAGAVDAPDAVEPAAQLQVVLAHLGLERRHDAARSQPSASRFAMS